MSPSSFDTVALTLFGVLALAFVAYEMAAERGAPWHTVSWYAQHRKPVRVGIVALAIIFILWFVWHTRAGAPIFT